MNLQSAGAQHHAIVVELGFVSRALLAGTVNDEKGWPLQWRELGRWLESLSPERFTSEPILFLQETLRTAVNLMDPELTVPGSTLSCQTAAARFFDPSLTDGLRQTYEGKAYDSVLKMLVKEANVAFESDFKTRLSKFVRPVLASSLLQLKKSTVPGEDADQEFAEDGQDDEIQPFAYDFPRGFQRDNYSNDISPLTVNLELSISDQGRVTPNVSLQVNDYDTWFDEMFASKFDNRPRPRIYVELEADPTTTVTIYNSNNVADAEFYNAGRIVRQFRNATLKAYWKTIEVVVEECLRIAVQHLDEYYPRLADLQLLLDSFLNERWMEGVGTGSGSVYYLEMWIDSRTSKRLVLSNEYARSRNYTDDSDIIFLHNLGSVVFLGEQYMVDRGLPAIISRGLEGGVVRPHAKFFNPGSWSVGLA